MPGDASRPSCREWVWAGSHGGCPSWGCFLLEEKFQQEVVPQSRRGAPSKGTGECYLNSFR